MAPTADLALVLGKTQAARAAGHAQADISLASGSAIADTVESVDRDH